MRRVPGRRRSSCQKDVEDASPAKRMQRGRGAAAATARKRLKDKDRTCRGDAGGPRVASGCRKAARSQSGGFGTRRHGRGAPKDQATGSHRRLTQRPGTAGRMWRPVKGELNNLEWCRPYIFNDMNQCSWDHVKVKKKKGRLQNSINAQKERKDAR